MITKYLNVYIAVLSSYLNASILLIDLFVQLFWLQFKIISKSIYDKVAISNDLLYEYWQPLYKTIYV